MSDTSVKASQDIAALYRRYSGGLSRYVARTFGSGPPEPEDVVHAVFERYAALADAERILDARAFLFRSARNYVIDEKRRQMVRTDYVREIEKISEQTDDLHAERVLDSKESWSAIETAINQLDPRSRKFLLMSRIHGLSSAEIARQNNCSPTLVKAIIARALVACHRALIDGE